MALQRFMKKFGKESISQPAHIKTRAGELTISAREPNTISAEDLVEKEEPFELSTTQKNHLRSSWKIIYQEIGRILSFVSDKEDGIKLALKLFQEYPQSQQFFLDFQGTPIEALKNDPKLNYAMQQHAIRVTRIVEKIVARLDHLEMVNNKHIIYSISCVTQKTFRLNSICANWELHIDFMEFQVHTCQ